MRFRKIFVFLFLFICICQFTSAQKPVINKDTSDALEQDTSNIYKDIETFSKKRKFTQFFHRLIFKPVQHKSTKQKKRTEKQIRKTYVNFEGKIIRNINIVTLDPFGYSINDTTIKPHDDLSITGNDLHINTRSRTIRNLLRIQKNKPFDSLLVNESERLIRSQQYIQDVLFNVVKSEKQNDSVDIYIRVLDRWSIIPKFDISKSNFLVDLSDNNFLGTGHILQNAFNWIKPVEKLAYDANYFIPNIMNTYINATLHYGIDVNKNTIISAGVERPFFSPYTEWAGGANVSQRLIRDLFKYTTVDYWAGKSFKIFKGNTENERATNLIIAQRVILTRYSFKPDDKKDTLHIYSDADSYLTGIGISTRKYVKDKYIFNFGITEDVPVGKVYGLTLGYVDNSYSNRLYLGLRYSFGDYIEWGYLSSSFEYGTFLSPKHMQQRVITASANYFTHLFKLGSWKFRQFVKPQITIGINRYPGESININNENGIRGFISPSLKGTKKVLLTMQTQSYAPWNVLGFRFGPFFNFSLATLGNSSTGFSKSKLFSQFGLGILIRNDYLVFNSFHLSLSFYPIIPGTGKDIFKANSINITDLSFRDFQLGKPATVGYR